MVFIGCIVLFPTVGSGEMRISKKKIILSVMMLLLPASFVWGILCLKRVADYNLARNTVEV